MMDTRRDAKTTAYSQQAHCLLDAKTNESIDMWTVADSCTMTPREQLQWMGYSVRTGGAQLGEWRFTAWVAWDGAALAADWARINATELYSHAGDGGTGPDAFDEFENANVVKEHPEVAAVFQRHWP